MQQPPLFILDSYALIYRSYFAFISRPLRNSKGKNVSALFGFSRIVANLLSDRHPKDIAAVFDPYGKTFRHEQYPAYKATRQKTPDDLHAQVPLVEEFLNRLGVPILRVEGFEADDIIATLVQKYRNTNRNCYIVSGDKDLLQLVGENIYELRPIKKQAASGASFVSPANKTATLLPKPLLNGFEIIDSEAVRKEWGVEPAAILDYLSLTGDHADNVPGVSGIGDKTAQKLMLRYGTLETIYENIAGIEAPISKKLALNRENAFMSRQLITLRTDVPLPDTIFDCQKDPSFCFAEAAAYLREHEIRTIAQEFSAEPGTAHTNPVTPAQVLSRIGKAGIPGIPPEPIINSVAESTVFFTSADELPPANGEYHYITNIDVFKALLDKAAAQKVFAFDFETSSLETASAEIVGCSLALRPGEAFYVPFLPHGEDDAALNAPFIPEAQAKPLLSGIFACPDITIAAHNAKFDYKVSRAWGIPRWKAKIFDTMTAAWLIDPDSSYALDKLAAQYLSFHALISYKSIVPKNKTFQAVPLEIAARYSAEDADFCLRLKELFEREYLKDSLGALFFDLEMPILPVLAEMEIEGIRIDIAKLRNYGDDLARELSAIQFESWAMVGHEFNLASPLQLQHVLFTERGLIPTQKTSTGWSTDVSVLEALAAEDDLCKKILRHRTLSKLKTTYVDALCQLADSSGKLHTTFFQTGTATGRLSSRDPNLQNIPIREEEGRRIRQAFTAGEGRALISADYNQIELVVLAHLSQDVELCASFTAGEDVHRRTAALIFGITPDEVTSAQRRIAKTINFGVMYGMSAFRLAASLAISRPNAFAFINAYFKTYSGVRNFINALIADTEKTGWVTTMFGHRRFIRQINSSNKVEKAAAERIAVNTPIQGSAAGIVKRAMLDLDIALSAIPQAETKILLQVHDELILECNEEKAPEIAALVKRVMENAAPLRIPLRVNVETGKCWGEFH